jgi:DnaJ-class molecular chaperone
MNNDHLIGIDISRWRTCKTCGGSGVVSIYWSNNVWLFKDCPDCEGTGTPKKDVNHKKEESEE